MVYSSEITGKTIAELRKGRNWSQARHGKELHCTGKQVSLYESGKTAPPTDTLFRLCEIFNCELGFLLGEADYSEGTRIETAVHRETGLTKEAMDAIRLLTGEGKKSPCFGCESEEYRALFNRFLTSKQFPVFMDEMRHLDEAFQRHESIMAELNEKIGEDRASAALDLMLKVECLPDDLCQDVTQQEIDDMHLLEDAIDEKDSLSYKIKVLRYEVREAFEALLIDLYPRRLNE